MKRRNFLNNVVLGIAASLLPKILQPLEPEVVEEMVKVPYHTWVVSQIHPNGDITYKQGELRWADFRKKDVVFLENGAYQLKLNSK
jgi:hypothetical protein